MATVAVYTLSNGSKYVGRTTAIFNVTYNGSGTVGNLQLNYNSYTLKVGSCFILHAYNSVTPITAYLKLWLAKESIFLPINNHNINLDSYTHNKQQVIYNSPSL